MRRRSLFVNEKSQRLQKSQTSQKKIPLKLLKPLTLLNPQYKRVSSRQTISYGMRFVILTPIVGDITPLFSLPFIV